MLPGDLRSASPGSGIQSSHQLHLVHLPGVVHAVLCRCVHRLCDTSETMAKATEILPQHQELTAPTSDYVITITDCNSIAEAHITLRRDSLNIKYGPNGIGKSTIAHALLLNAQGEDALQRLLPFKYRRGDTGKAPAVVGADEIKNVLVFDENYVSQFCFPTRRGRQEQF